MLVDVYSKTGQTVGKIELAEQVFAIEPNEHVMHQAVVAYLANQRQGTKKTKIRSEVSGGGKKPWKQKGRGTARAGSTRSPLWVGGGTIHGPQPTDYSIKLPAKVRRLAKKSAYSVRASENNIIVVEDFTFEQFKTKSFAEVLAALNIKNTSVLVLMPSQDTNVYMSSRNIPNVSVNVADKISTYDILKHKKLVLFKGAVDVIVSSFSN